MAVGRGRAIVVMGVTGVGKTTVGRLLAARAGCRFVEGDELHPAANVAKMSAGQPLDDADRLPWLAAIARVIDSALVEGQMVVVACSALKRSYRQVLGGGDCRVIFVHLTGQPALVASRLAGRKGHFMPPQLLASQFAALEPPDDLNFAVDAPPDTIAAAIETELMRRGLLPDDTRARTAAPPAGADATGQA